MNAIDIITLIAIILFARLGIRLVGKYPIMKEDPKRKKILKVIRLVLY